MQRSSHGPRMKDFYRQYCRAPNFKFSDDYSYREDGDIDAPKGEIILPTYRRTTREELESMEAARAQRIQTATEAYDRARQELHAEFQGEKDHNRLHELNREVRQADMKLQQARYAYSNVIQDKKRYTYRQIMLDQLRDTRTFPSTINMLQTFPFSLQRYYVREEGVVNQENVAIAPTQQVILFGSATNQQYGFMSLGWEVEIEVQSLVDRKTTLYHSAQQAILAEMAKYFRDEIGLDRVMTATKPDEIEYSVANVPGVRAENEIQWNAQYEKLMYQVNLSKFQQYPALAQQLLQTGEARLGATEPADASIYRLNTGNTDDTNPAFWTGKNILGEALMRVREYIKSHQPAVLPEVVQKKRASRPRPRLPSLGVQLPPPLQSVQPQLVQLNQMQPMQPMQSMQPNQMQLMQPMQPNQMQLMQPMQPMQPNQMQLMQPMQMQPMQPNQMQPVQQQAPQPVELQPVQLQQIPPMEEAPQPPQQPPQAPQPVQPAPPAPRRKMPPPPPI